MRIATRALIVLLALGSLACTLYAGRNNHSTVLIVLFGIWVLAPFVALLAILPRWERAMGEPTGLRACLIALSSVVFLIYLMNSLHPGGHHAAAPFLLAPAGIWGAAASGFFFVRSRP
ncbi:hypothetical protein DYQ86_17320 [Acidobacteria bacterium AB60]|nr:hypothetical protein DYQ86_17320 [Acidobacteria bacterium AB60]